MRPILADKTGLAPQRRAQEPGFLPCAANNGPHPGLRHGSPFQALEWTLRRAPASYSISYHPGEGGTGKRPYGQLVTFCGRTRRERHYVEVAVPERPGVSSGAWQH
jgi:hypothetical protein